jgi:hypothetical protein
MAGLEQPQRYEVLPGLPPYGPPAVVFSATGQRKHSEGFVVRFFPRTGESWVGNFISALCGVSGVFSHPDGRHLIVLSAGEGYVIDPETRQCVHCFGGQVVNVIPIPQLELLVVGNGLWFEAIGRNGILWKSPRISWDGMRNLEVHDFVLSGEAYDPMTNDWRPFKVDVLSGKPNGGSYSGPVM